MSQRGRRPSRRDEHAARLAAVRAQVALGPIRYPEQLPVSARRDEIAAAVAAHQVVVVSGETGSGKTTQLPKICLELGRGRAGQIGHTQPRRIAARAVAERVAEELGTTLGHAVGYQVRFTDTSSDSTLVKVMTDGILLAQVQRDPLLRAYDTIIVDEAHERSLNIDFLLGYLTDLLPRRPDLKVVITSATIDSAKFAAHFGTAGPGGRVPAPVIEVTGRTYPVEVRYRPLAPELPSDDPDEAPDSPAPRGGAGPSRTGTSTAKADKAGGARGGGSKGGGGRAGSAQPARATVADRDLMTGICEAVDELIAEGPGDILVFTSGEREIRDATDALRASLGPRVTDPRHPAAVELLPLYSRLSAAEQHRVFEPHTTRRVVLATNVAETSLTVPGVRYVVDPGTARISRYSKTTKVQRLPIEAVSQASADQRAGRCGRVADGVAIRLYSRQDYDGRPRFTEPEILRTSLASVILQMVAVGVVPSPDEVATFGFVDPPDVRAVRDGVALLTELGALAPRTAPSTSGSGDDGPAPSENPAPQDRAGAGAAGGSGPRDRGVGERWGSSTRRRGSGPRDRGVGLTEVGRTLARLPIDPRLARMIVEAGRRGVAREVVVVAAALSVQDPRERPVEDREAADALHRRFVDPTSDLLGYLNLWTWLRERRRELSGSALRRTVRSQYLNYLRIREWQDVVTQLRELTAELGIDAKGAPRPLADRPPDAAAARPGKKRRGKGRAAEPGGRSGEAGRAGTAGTAPGDDGPGTQVRLDRVVPAGHGAHQDVGERTTWTWDADAVHQSVLAGVLSQVGMQEVAELRSSRSGPSARDSRRQRTEYLGARGARFALWPASALAKKPAPWVMAAELVETSRLWARDVARIRPEWAEEIGAHLVRRVYSDPGWAERQGAATVTEKVFLYGVPLVADRRVLLAKTDPETARELFVRHALVAGEWHTHWGFWAENQRLLDEAQGLEARTRRRDLLADDEALFDFYDERIPDGIVSTRHFDRWWDKTRRDHPDLLTFTRELLLGPDAAEVDATAFPTVWPVGDARLTVTYHFDPGGAADGVAVLVPLALLPRLDPRPFTWLVPGLRRELITATVRALPKPLRVALVPAPDTAAAVASWLDGAEPAADDEIRASTRDTSLDVRISRGSPYLADGPSRAEPRGPRAKAFPGFHEAFARAVLAVRGVVVPEDAFDDERLPAHLRITFRVVSDAGVVLAEGKDLRALQRQLAAEAQDAVSQAVRTALRTAMDEARGSTPASPTTITHARGPAGADAAGAATPGTRTPTGPAPAGAAPGSGTSDRAGPPPPRDADLEQTGLTSWPRLDGPLPLEVTVTSPAGPVRGYPALADEDGTVALRVLADARHAAASHRAGLCRLLVADVGLPTARITSRWTGTQALALAASPYPSTQALVTDVQLAAVAAVLAEELPDGTTPVRDADAYAAVRARVRQRLEDEVHTLVSTLVDVLTAWRDLDAALREATSLALVATASDVRDQQRHLVYDGFVARTGPDRLRHLVRYLRAAAYRLDRAGRDVHRDQALAAQVREVTDEIAAARDALGPDDPTRAAALDDLRWQVEELRVSLFAQQLGTPTPVSAQRIRKALGKVG